MTIIPATIAESGALDSDTLVALREILEDPSLPVDAVLAGPDGRRLARLREALDHLVTVHAGAVALDGRGAELVAILDALDADVAAVARRHVAVVEALLALEPGRARNAVLGDAGRGDLLSFVGVRSWSWSGEGALREATGVLVSDEFPGLVDALLAWHPDTGGLVAVPTNRQRVTWAPVDDGTWEVTVDAATFHAYDVVPVAVDPR